VPADLPTTGKKILSISAGSRGRTVTCSTPLGRQGLSRHTRSTHPGVASPLEKLRALYAGLPHGLAGRLTEWCPPSALLGETP
jgi:hypothetical protein